MSHVFLIGFMGAGKSTVSRLVAEELGRPCIDLDEAIETAAGRTVREIFEDAGEDVFREFESAQLEALLDAVPSVVACGGGIVVRNENRSALKRMGLEEVLLLTGERTPQAGFDYLRGWVSSST